MEGHFSCSLAGLRYGRRVASAFGSKALEVLPPPSLLTGLVYFETWKSFLYFPSEVQ